MASFSRRIILGNFRELFTSKSSFSSSSFFNNKWRISQNLEPNPNSFGPLTDLPDYSYVNGRPVPLSKTRTKKMKLQQQYCERIAKLSYEMDEAIKYHKKIIEDDAKTKNKILSSKLKPKGKAQKF